MKEISSRGFGYVKTPWVVNDDTLSLSSDSDLSSTSLLATLIKPSSSEEIFFKRQRDDSEEELYLHARESVRGSISYFRQVEAPLTKQSINIDYEVLRKRDSRRQFERQSIPVLSEKSRQSLRRRFSAGQSQTDDLIIPLMSHFGTKPRGTWKGRPSGQVAELLKYMSSNVPMSTRRRSQYIKLVKEQLDAEEDLERRKQDSETEEERKSREEKESAKKKREEEVFSRHTEREKMVIKENLGSVPTMKQPVFIPFGKESILVNKKVDPERFFMEESTQVPSYDEYYSRPVDFGNTRVRSSAYVIKGTING